VTGFGAYLFVSPRVRGPWLRSTLIPQNTVTAAVGLSLLALGIVVMFWARAILGRNWSGIVTIKEDHQLIRRGPYAFARHPIYTGILTALLGSTIALGQVRHVLGWLIVAVGLWLKSRVEERWLTQEFGAAYENYRREVPALVPFLRAKDGE
jgi:protein-S-isoprenylcysteine O-methyltransferase Ste14